MTDVTIVNISGKAMARMNKLLWHESEFILAKCLNFTIEDDQKTIYTFIERTSKEALEGFLKVAFRNFSESPTREHDRNLFWKHANEAWEQRNAYVTELMQQRVPYYDKLMIHQKDVLMESFCKKNNFLAMDMGTGKAQPLTSMVLTPSGFVEMGSLKIGSVVIDKDGNDCFVIGIYPQGKKEVFKITFSDGAVTHSCGEHLWLVSNEGYKHVVHPLNYFKDKLKTSKGLLKWSVPTQPVIRWDYTTEKLPLHPYALGALIGNGSTIKKIDFSCDHKDASFFIPKLKETLPGCEIKKQGGENYSWNIYHNGTSVNSYVAKALDELGLLGCRSGDKFIPKKYLYASVENRIELLKGLMDTDGHASPIKSKTSFSTSSPKLRDDFMFLVRSLGGVARYAEDVREGKNTGYSVHVTLKDIIPFSIPRKAERCHKKIRMIGRRIKSVESIGEVECQCISVSSPTRTYITDDFIVTHNTITSATISRLHKLPRTVIICPAAVKFNWFRDLQKFGFNPVYFTMYDSAKRRSFKAFIERFIIINYDIIAKYGPEIVNYEVDHFILDEAHYIKSHLSQRAKLVNKLISHSPNARITFLSGTPITNRVNDIFSYLKLTGHELGHSHKRFLDQFTIRSNSRGGERVTGGKNLDDLRLKLSNFMIRKSKDDCLDLPEKVFLSYTYELDDYRDEYVRVVEELKASKEKTQLSGNIHSLNIITAMAKLAGIKEIAQNILDEERKVVIFSSYKEPLNKLQEHFGMSCVKIDGSVSAFDRDQMVQRFIEDPNVTVFLGNMQAAGVGINLVNASDVLFVNFPLVPSDFYQAVDRCHRIGQSKSVNIHLPMCVDSIDEHIHNLILEKDMEASIVIDGKINETLLKENFVDILIKKIKGIEVVAPVIEQPSPFPVSSIPVEVKSNLDDFNEPDFL